MAIADRLRAAGRWVSGSGRSASLSLAERSPRPDTTERGSNSVSYAASKDGTGALIDPEYKYELRGRQGGRMYQRMRWSDPHIAGLRQAQNLPMLQASATVQPADPGDKDAVAKAELVERLLLNDFPWRSFLQDTLLALDYGFACFEICWDTSSGEARCRLALRPSSSIRSEDIHVRSGAIDHVVQRPIDGGERLIPGEKLVWFCHQKEGDSFTGRSILRPMYKPWKIKEELEIELPILARKLGGVPDIETDDEPDDATAATLDTMGRRFGLTPDAFFRHTSDVRVSLLTGNANINDILAAIRQRDTEITSVCQGQVFDLGVTNAGSRALGTTLSDLFTNGVQAEAKAREDILNASGGLVHQLVAYNFPRDDNLPKLRFGNVQAVDLRSFAQALLWFSQAFPGLPDELQDWVRAETGMPEASTTQVVVDAQRPHSDLAVGKAAAPSADSPAGTGPGETGAKASERRSRDRLTLADRRQPRGVEVYLNLAEITAKFDTTKAAVKEATQATRKALTAKLVKDARAAAAAGALAAFAASAPPMVAKLTAEIAAVLRDFYAAGRRQVAGELRRQRAGEPWTPESVRAAETPLGPAEPSAEGLLALKEQAEAMGRAIAAATQAASVVQAARTAAGTPIDEATMVAMVLRESDGAALRFAGATSDFMSMGRADEAREQSQDIEDAVYSALLDGRTCSACEPMDGETTTDLQLAESWAPNPMCEGGPACRCLVVYEVRQGG